MYEDNGEAIRFLDQIVLAKSRQIERGNTFCALVRRGRRTRLA